MNDNTVCYVIRAHLPVSGGGVRFARRRHHRVLSLLRPLRLDFFLYSLLERQHPLTLLLDYLRPLLAQVQVPVPFDFFQRFNRFFTQRVVLVDDRGVRRHFTYPVDVVLTREFFATCKRSRDRYRSLIRRRKTYLVRHPRRTFLAATFR